MTRVGGDVERLVGIVSPVKQELCAKGLCPLTLPLQLADARRMAAARGLPEASRWLISSAEPPDLPEAAGKRYLALADGPTISFRHMAQILRERLGPLAERVPTEEAPGPEPPRLIIHNDRAKQELGWRPRPAETTLVETAESLRDLGLLEKR